jgi:hypothetical protein
MTKFRGVLPLAVLAMAACNRSSSESATSGSSTGSSNPGAAMSSSATAPNTASSTLASSCPRTGLWALCSVEDRLTDAGFVLRRVSAASPHRAGFRVDPAVYTLGGKRLEVFIYPSESALSADIAKIDTLSAAPNGAPNPWGMVPTFVHSGNLAAVYLTDNGTQAERLTLALTAGAPQR